MIDFNEFLTKNAKGKNYVILVVGDESPEQQDVVQQKSDIAEVQPDLTAEEIAFVKKLFAQSQINNEQHFFANDKPMLVVPVMAGAKKTTGISVYVEQWERWSAFKNKHSMYSGTDLLAMALDDFMNRHDDATDE